MLRFCVDSRACLRTCKERKLRATRIHSCRGKFLFHPRFYGNNHESVPSRENKQHGAREKRLNAVLERVSSRIEKLLPFDGLPSGFRFAHLAPSAESTPGSCLFGSTTKTQPFSCDMKPSNIKECSTQRGSLVD